MTTRRKFFQSMLAAPLVAVGVKLAPKVFQLPIGCDLGFGPLEWACQEARRLNLGRGRVLLIGPENIETARMMLGVPGKAYYPPDDVSEALQREYFRYEVRDDLPLRTWRVVFDRGTIESRGPA